MKASLKANQPIDVKKHPTIVDSLCGGIGLNNQHTFAMVKRYVDDVILVDEKTIKQGMKHLFYQENRVVEGASGITVRALLNSNTNQSINHLLGKKIVVILSGKNINMDTFLAIMNEKSEHY